MVDFVIDKINGITSYHSTNMACPIYGYKENSSPQETIHVLRKQYGKFGKFSYFTLANTGEDKSRRDFRKEDVEFIKVMRERSINLHNSKYLKLQKER